MKFNCTVKPISKRRRGGRKVLSERCVLLTQRLYARGLTMREVAARVGIALGSVHKIISGKHVNRTRSLDDIKKEESVRLYNRLRKAKHSVFSALPPLYKIDWMRIRGRVLLIDKVLARRVGGVLIDAEWLGRGKAA